MSSSQALEVCITIDVEHDCPPFLTTYRGIEHGMPRLLALFHEEAIAATFFTTGDVARRYPDTVRAVVAAGHELALVGGPVRDAFLGDDARPQEGTVRREVRLSGREARRGTIVPLELPIRGTCVGCAVGLACGAPVDCGSGVCLNGGCAAPACGDGVKNGSETDVDCGGTCPVCNDNAGCNSNADCPATSPICEPNTKSCAKCTQNSDCPATSPRCAVRKFECVQCLTNADCPAGQACNGDNRCEARCTGDAQCSGNTPKCNVASGDCVQCVGAPDCAGRTNQPLCAPNHRCVQCVTAADCGDGGTPFCRNSQCAQCRNDKDCPGNNGKCQDGSCR
mgnify:CR=1 FL=1